MALPHPSRETPIGPRHHATVGFRLHRMPVEVETARMARLGRAGRDQRSRIDPHSSCGARLADMSHSDQGLLRTTATCFSPSFR
jgi:hypothetical protein